MLGRLAGLVLRCPKRLLGAALVVFILASSQAPLVSHDLTSGGFDDPSSESSRADQLLSDARDGSGPNLVLVVSSPGGVRSTEVRDEADRVEDELRRHSQVADITSFTEPAGAALISADGNSGLITARVESGPNSGASVATAIRADLARDDPGPTTVSVGGQVLANHDIIEQMTHDFAVAEMVTLPITGIALLIVFGSPMAALLPLIIGVISGVGTLAVLRMIALNTDVSIFALNLTTGLSLALAIDYSLLVVSRYREELQADDDPAKALLITMRTAGRTVAFSGTIVALAVCSLLVFPLPFLRSFAYAGVSVVALAVAAALVVLPALLTLTGPLVRRRGRRYRPRRASPDLERTAWFRMASAASRFAVPALVVGTSALVLLGSPFLGVRWGPADDRVLPSTSTARQVGDALRSDFAAASPTLTVVLPRELEQDAIADYARRLSEVAGVSRVSSPAGTYSSGRKLPTASPMSGDVTVLQVFSELDPLSQDAADLLEECRKVAAPSDALLTGPVAKNHDSVQSLKAHLPAAALIIAASTMVVVFMLTGSVLLPVKAIALTALSLAATFGAMVWIFQDGHLAGLIGADPVGFLVPTMPVLMFCLSFGMSMDYEVFLLSRVHEEWLSSAGSRTDNRNAVRYGLAKSGRIVSAAALLMGLVFLGLVSSQVSVMKMFGLGLALFVLIDATVIRGVLLPSFMELAGRANWWAPQILVRFHRRFGWHD